MKTAPEPKIDRDRMSDGDRELWAAYWKDRSHRRLELLMSRYRSLLGVAIGQMRNKLPRQVLTDDIGSAALVGLWDAIVKYTSSSGVPFETYAKKRIKGAVLDQVRRGDAASRTIRAYTNKRDKVIDKFTTRHGRKPTDRELASLLRRSMQSIKDREAGVAIASSTPISTYRDERGEDFEPEGTMSPDSITRESVKETEYMLVGLQERERAVLLLQTVFQMPLWQIGWVLSIHESTAAEVAKLAKSILRKRVADPCRHSKTPSEE